MLNNFTNSPPSSMQKLDSVKSKSGSISGVAISAAAANQGNNVVMVHNLLNMSESKGNYQLSASLKKPVPQSNKGQLGRYNVNSCLIDRICDK